MKSIIVYHLCGKTRELPMELTFGGDVGLTEQAWKGQLEGASYKKVVTFLVGDHQDPDELLDTIFEVTNTIDAPWYENPDPLMATEPPHQFRSTSVGDIIVTPKNKWLVMGCGFEKLDV